MTNNKQQTAMKLYTKNDLIVAIGLTRHGNPNWSIDEIVNDITPIELPSDEEIYYAETQMPMNTFELGAKWVRNKIQGDKL